MQRELWLRIGTGLLGVALAAAGCVCAAFFVYSGTLSAMVPNAQVAQTSYRLECALDQDAAKKGSGVWLVYHEQSLPDAIFDRVVTDSAGVWNSQTVDSDGARFYQKNDAGLDTWRIELSSGKRECTVTLVDDALGGVYEIRRYCATGEDTAAVDAAIAAFSLTER